MPWAGFARALEEDYGARLDAEGLECIRHIGDSAQWMDALITDLLNYSRLGQVDLSTDLVDMEAVVHAALVQCGLAQSEGVDIEIEHPLPALWGHEATLKQVLGNLLTNAVKFVSTGTRPRIRVRARDAGEGWVRVTVEDNGIGIEPEYQDRIFQIFERLQDVEAYPGTGIGLAIVRRGCERMGGRCGVASEPGQGSRFWIELPDRPAGRRNQEC